MKFNFFKIIFLIITLINDITIICIRLQTTTNRSLMSFMNGLFSPKDNFKSTTDFSSNKDFQINDSNTKYNNRLRKSDAYRFNQILQNPSPQINISQENKEPKIEYKSKENKKNDKSPSSTNINKSEKDQNTLIENCENNSVETDQDKIIFQGWLMISSSYFLDRKLFPINLD
jgi:hypothetical protein